MSQKWGPPFRTYWLSARGLSLHRFVFCNCHSASYLDQHSCSIIDGAVSKWWSLPSSTADSRRSHQLLSHDAELEALINEEHFRKNKCIFFYFKLHFLYQFLFVYVALGIGRRALGIPGKCCASDLIMLTSYEYFSSVFYSFPPPLCFYKIL